ncbi:hypothetical protein GYMLUDRAFT_255322 [Collybiopsis luxurians FD-317 M1]|nr:hypothetical protein GYMLUDRAFT_255322 [Collybiopsis luxurians FD-317 M1]
MDEIEQIQLKQLVENPDVRRLIDDWMSKASWTGSRHAFDVAFFYLWTNNEDFYLGRATDIVERLREMALVYDIGSILLDDADSESSEHSVTETSRQSPSKEMETERKVDRPFETTLSPFAFVEFHNAIDQGTIDGSLPPAASAIARLGKYSKSASTVRHKASTVKPEKSIPKPVPDSTNELEAGRTVGENSSFPDLSGMLFRKAELLLSHLSASKKPRAEHTATKDNGSGRTDAATRNEAIREVSNHSTQSSFSRRGETNPNLSDVTNRTLGNISESPSTSPEKLERTEASSSPGIEMQSPAEESISHPSACGSTKDSMNVQRTSSSKTSMVSSPLSSGSLSSPLSSESKENQDPSLSSPPPSRDKSRSSSPLTPLPSSSPTSRGSPSRFKFNVPPIFENTTLAVSDSVPPRLRRSARITEYRERNSKVDSNAAGSSSWNTKKK